MKTTFSKETLETLKRLYDVNQSLKLVEGEEVLKVKSTDSTMLVHAPIADAVPRDFHIYDLREFLSVLGIIEDPVLDFENDKFLEVRSQDGKQKLRYLESDPEFVTSHTDKIPPIDDFEVELSVSEAQFSSIIKAASTMKLDYIGFMSDGKTVKLSAFNKNNGNDEMTNNFSIDIGESDDKFELFYKIDTQNVNVLHGEGDLEFELSSKKISKITTKTEKTFWIAMNTNSKYGG